MSKQTGFPWRLVLGVLCATLFLTPVFMAVGGSLWPRGDFLSLGQTSSGISWGNYRAVFETVQFERHLSNSFLVVILATPFSLIFSSLAAFSIIEQRQPMRRWLVVFAIVTMLIPPSAVWLFRFQLFELVGLIDSRFALIFPALSGGNSLFVLIYFWAWMRVPAELFDAARIDGAPFLTRWRLVALPLVRPATAAVALLAFTMFWGNFIEPVLFIYDPDKYTVPVGLQLLNQLDASNRPVLLAAAVLAMIPPLLMFGVTQRWFLHSPLSEV